MIVTQNSPHSMRWPAAWSVPALLRRIAMPVPVLLLKAAIVLAAILFTLAVARPPARAETLRPHPLICKVAGSVGCMVPARQPAGPEFVMRPREHQRLTKTVRFDEYDGVGEAGATWFRYDIASGTPRDGRVGLKLWVSY